MKTIHLDWLSLYGQIGCDPDSMSEDEAAPFVYLRSLDRTAWFLRGLAIGVKADDGSIREAATLLWCPSSPIMSKSTCTIKLANSLLYERDYFKVLIELLRVFCIYDTSVTRADIAIDFDRCDYGGIRGHELARMLSECRFIRRGGRKFTTVSKCSYKINGDTVSMSPHCDGLSNIESITFGSLSGTQAQLYNKSEEIRQHVVDGKATKQYIRDCWTLAGIEQTYNDVWRLELRLNSKARTLVTQDGEMRPCMLVDYSPEHLVATATAALAKWFQLYDARYGMHTHLSRMREVSLFDLSRTVMFYATPTMAARQSTYTKGVINALKAFTRWRPYLADPSDIAILNAAGDVAQCIYSEQRREERKNQRAKFRQFILDYYRITPPSTDSDDIFMRYVARSGGYINRELSTVFVP